MSFADVMFWLAVIFAAIPIALAGPLNLKMVWDINRAPNVERKTYLRQGWGQMMAIATGFLVIDLILWGTAMFLH